MKGRAARLMEKFQTCEEHRELSERVRLALRLGQMAYEMRTHAGLSQDALAQRVGTTQSALSRLESGNAGHVPTHDMMERIAEHCGYRLTMSAEASRVPADTTEVRETITVSLG